MIYKNCREQREKAAEIRRNVLESIATLCQQLVPLGLQLQHSSNTEAVERVVQLWTNATNKDELNKVTKNIFYLNIYLYISCKKECFFRIYQKWLYYFIHFFIWKGPWLRDMNLIPIVGSLCRSFTPMRLRCGATREF